MTTGKETKIQVTGLVQQPNPYSAAPAGSLSMAMNCVSRRKGVIEPLPGNVAQSGIVMAPDCSPIRLFNNWEQSYFISIEKFDGDQFGTELRFSDSATYYSLIFTGNTSYLMQYDPGATQATFSRFRHIISEHSAPVTVEAFSTTAHSTPRMTGLPNPLFCQPSYIADTPANSITGYVAYQAIFRKVYTHFTVDSAPSPIGVGNGSSGSALFVTVYFDPNKDPVRAGDNIVLYRVQQQATFNLLGDDYRQVSVYEITSTDIANGYALIQDRVLDADLGKGAPLYTNSLQEGITQTNLMPPPCVDVATYNDTTFYVSKSSWPIVSLSVPGKFGTLAGGTADVRKNGIGFRTVSSADSTASVNTLSDIPDVTGIAVGQVVVASSAGFPVGTKVTNISGGPPYTITFDQNASTTFVGGTAFICDTVSVRAYKGVSLVASGYVPLVVDLDNWIPALAAAVPGIKVQINSPYDPAASTIPGLDFAVWSPISGIYDRLEVDVTNGQNYANRGTMTGTTGTYRSIQDNAINRAYYSKTSLPEAVAPVNFLDVGNERVLKLWPSESALFAFCTDGLWRITGSGTDWTVNQIDKTVSLVHPDCVTGGENTIFAWCVAGISSVGENGAQVISREAIGPDLDSYMNAVRIAGAPFSFGPQMTFDHRKRELWLNIALRGTSSFSHLMTYIFNMDSGAFTQQTATAIRSLVYSDYLTQMWYTNELDYFLPSTSTWQDVTVVFNPIFAGELGNLKQWIDTNLFIDNIAFSGGTDSVVQILFGGETSGANNKATITATTGQNLHCWVPRRLVSKNQLVYGFTTNPDSSIKMNFRCYGFTVRYRVASETLKR